MDLTGQEEAPKDPGAQKAVQSYDETDFEGHRAHSVFVGAHLPTERRHSHRRHKHHHRGSISSSTDDDRPCTPPAQRVQFILGEDITDDSHDSHPLFTEMLELVRLGPDGDDYEWKETARWIKFEEDVEEGGNRWSKPHVATLSLHSLFELRSHLLNGTVLLDMEATTLDQVVNLFLDHAVNSGLLGATPPERKAIIHGLLLKRCKHQHQTKRLLPMIRSFAEIGRNHSSPRSGCLKPLLSCVSKQQPPTSTTTTPYKKPSRLTFQPQQQTVTPRRVSSAISMKSMSRNNSFGSNLVPARHLNRQNSGAYMPVPVDEPSCENNHHDKQTDNCGHGGGNFLTIPGQGGFSLTTDSHCQTPRSIPKSVSSHIMLSRNHSSNDLVNGDISPGSQQHQQHNLNFMRKIPPGAEAGNILVGEIECLDRPLSAFVRLRNATILGDLTEVPVPTRFIFILLTPPSTLSTNSNHQEIGRAMATLMSDEVFHEVAYRARNRSHILAGVDEFLDAVTVLPPGEWDPAIRIEPPAAIPSQDTRKRPPSEKPLEELDEEMEEQRLREESGLARTGRLFGGLINDVKRKAPFYWSDFRDGASLQCVASWIFLYFACLSPIITFGGLLSKATGRNMAAMESLVSGFVCGMIYGLFSGQPLTILGSTGPVLIFESIMYDYCDYKGWDYLSFRFWIGMWIALILFILVAVDASALVCYITRFTEENFACLIAFIFIFKALENVREIGEDYPLNDSGLMNLSYDCSCYANETTQDHFPNITNWTDLSKSDCLNFNGTLIGDGCYTKVYYSDVYLMAIILFLGTFILSMTLKDFKNALFFPTKVRQLISDFSIIIVIILMSALDYYMGVPTPKLEVPHEFKPTLPGRGWIVDPLKNGVDTWFLAMLPALLGTILLFMDQQITTVIINRKENKLKKGCGYHLDLFVLSILIFICSAVGIPWFCAATVLSINHVNSLKLESECAAPGEKPQFLGVREQRFTHVMIFLTIGLSVFLTPILGHIPMPVLYGVFLYMGVASLRGIQFFGRILIMFMPNKYQPDYMYLRKVPIKRVHLFTIIQFTCLCCLWSIKSFKPTSILFPLMLVVMIGIRKALDWMFTQRELKILDDVMPEFIRRADGDHADNVEHVQSLMRHECKCHGMSGSCTVKTCWMRLPPFRVIGDQLKDRFDGASRVQVSNGAGGNNARNSVNSNKHHHKQNNAITTNSIHSKRDNRGAAHMGAMKRHKYNFQLKPYNPDHKPPGPKDLVYWEPSPGFCERNVRLGIQGTHGRQCNITSIGVDGCELMCCGRNHQPSEVVVVERCNCTFHWCCEVKCDICRTKKTIYTCL